MQQQISNQSVVNAEELEACENNRKLAEEEYKKARAAAIKTRQELREKEDANETQAALIKSLEDQIQKLEDGDGSGYVPGNIGLARECERQKAELQAQIDARDAKDDRRLSEIRELRDEIEKKNIVTQQYIKALEGKASPEKADLRRQIDDAEKLVEEKEKDIEDKEEQIKKLSERVKGCEERVKDPPAADPESQAAELQRQIDEASIKIAQLKEEIGDLETVLKEEKKLVEELQGRVELLEDETKYAQEIIAEQEKLTKHLETSCEEERNRLKRELLRLRHELENKSDPDIGADPDFDLPFYKPFSLSKIPSQSSVRKTREKRCTNTRTTEDLKDSAVKDDGHSSIDTFNLVIMRVKDSIHNCHVSRAIRGAANGDTRVALMASREALQIAEDLGDPTMIARGYFYYGYCLWDSFEVHEAMNAFDTGLQVAGASEEIREELQHWNERLLDGSRDPNYRGPSRERAPYAKKLLREFWQKDE